LTAFFFGFLTAFLAGFLAAFLAGFLVVFLGFAAVFLVVVVFLTVVVVAYPRTRTVLREIGEAIEGVAEDVFDTGEVDDSRFWIARWQTPRATGIGTFPNWNVRDLELTRLRSVAIVKGMVR
jgi:hypothetical protein